MRLNLFIIVLSFLSFICNAQNEKIILRDCHLISSVKYREYQLLSKTRFFKDQKQINFNKPENSLMSTFCTNSNSVYEKYVLGDEPATKSFPIFNNYDSTRSWISNKYLVQFNYKKEKYCILRYELVLDNKTTTEARMQRFKYIREKGEEIYYVDKRENDFFLNDITFILGVLKKSFIRLIFSIDKPKTNKEKELLKLIIQEGNFNISKLLELYKKHDKRLEPFIDISWETKVYYDFD